VLLTPPPHTHTQSLTAWAEDSLPQYMSHTQQQQWQPSLLLPDLSAPSGLQQLRGLREEADKLPTDVLVLLVSCEGGGHAEQGERGEESQSGRGEGKGNG
jgi:hypothetical protein